MTPLAPPFPKFGDGVCFARLNAAARELGLDLASFAPRSAAVTGSNGKGSTTAMTAALLHSTGARVGRFTSPHLFAINERIAINGEDIGDDALERHWTRALAAIAHVREQGYDGFGAFEFLFLIAADYFVAEQCDYIVWEAGIGGRYDPTRLVRARAAALTSLDLEHTALLGDTLELIAYDKLDIAPSNAKMFVADSCLPLRRQIEAYAALRELNASFLKSADAPEAPLAGAYQRSNAALAWALARELAPHLRDDLAKRALAEVRWPGRLETLANDPLIVIDVGHTPDAIAAALQEFAVMRGQHTGVLVCGVSEDKDATAILSLLAPAFANIICTRARHKGRPADEIATLARRFAPNADISCAIDCKAAHGYSIECAKRVDGAIFVAGGLFVAAEFRAAHLGREPAQLAFF